MQDQWNFTSWQKFRSLHTSAKERRRLYNARPVEFYNLAEI
jgi:hypothetical protein